MGLITSEKGHKFAEQIELTQVRQVAQEVELHHVSTATTEASETHSVPRTNERERERKEHLPDVIRKHP